MRDDTSKICIYARSTLSRVFLVINMMTSTYIRPKKNFKLYNFTPKLQNLCNLAPN